MTRTAQSHSPAFAAVRLVAFAPVAEATDGPDLRRTPVHPLQLWCCAEQQLGLARARPSTNVTIPMWYARCVHLVQFSPSA